MNQDPMAPGLVLTSMLKRVDFVVEDVVRTLSEGKEPSAVKRTYGMADGAIDLTDFQFTQQVVGDDLIARIGELRRQIVAGTLKTRSAPPPAVASDSILLPLPPSVGN
jgi:basic membrane protein A